MEGCLCPPPPGCHAQVSPCRCWPSSYPVGSPFADPHSVLTRSQIAGFDSGAPRRYRSEHCLGARQDVCRRQGRCLAWIAGKLSPLNEPHILRRADCLAPFKVVDAACAMPSLIMGEKLEVSKDMDTETRRVPLGVTAAICP